MKLRKSELQYGDGINGIDTFGTFGRTRTRKTSGTQETPKTIWKITCTSLPLSQIIRKLQLKSNWI